VSVVVVEGTGVGVSRPPLRAGGGVNVGVVTGSEIPNFEPELGEELESRAACFVFDQVRLSSDILRLSGALCVGACATSMRWVEPLRFDLPL